MQHDHRPASEPMWWWQLAKNLYDAQLSLANAMSHNVDDPRMAHALYERLRESQAILLEIFRAKGLVPAASPPAASPPAAANGASNGRPDVPSHAASPPFVSPPGGAQGQQPAPPAPPADDPTITASPMVDPAVGVVEPGQRHAMLLSLAGAMRFRGASYDEIEHQLLAVNQARCHPPKSDDEVKAIARWASDQPMTNGAHRPHAGEPAVSEADQQAVDAVPEPEPEVPAASGISSDAAEPPSSAKAVASGTIAEAAAEPLPSSATPVDPPRSGGVNG